MQRQGTYLPRRPPLLPRERLGVERLRLLDRLVFCVPRWREKAWRSSWLVRLGVVEGRLVGRVGVVGRVVGRVGVVGRVVGRVGVVGRVVGRVGVVGRVPVEGRVGVVGRVVGRVPVEGRVPGRRLVSIPGRVEPAGLRPSWLFPVFFQVFP